MLFVMTEIEKRRSELLEQMRTIYRDKHTPPAIHPRYQSAYRSIYKDDLDPTERNTSTFFVRVIIAFFVLVLFGVIDRRNETIRNMDSQAIIEVIREDLFGK